MKKFSVSVLASVLLLAGCSSVVSPTPVSDAEKLEDLRTTIAEGAECSELTPLFALIAENSDEFPSAQGEMINIGCTYVGAERTDSELSSVAPGSPWLGVPGERVTPSTTCTDSAKVAAAETDVTKADPLIIATLDHCETVSEWMSALELHPEVMGMMQGYIPQLIDLESVCYANVESAVCTDALEMGLAVGP
ncbi:hypothetical protein I6E52_03030 [Salinibacterium sp. NG253]|uniref:hypothetical protein n=1 Tax=Salinibacterium sp. NG253 TaxID=2792039 RepID=UPI0018CD5978|nr:hypothetical protein [Salinibacterium sp. NG253]MBH0115814.1 hypothetical protein [Salinibacterium sp. NG253]